MSNNLVKRLRDWQNIWTEDENEPEGHLYETAADRIEELEAKLAAEQGRIADLERRLKLWVPQNIAEMGRWPIREGRE